MAEGTYEFECMRAELLGLEVPDKEQFDLTKAETIKEKHETEEANELEIQDETLNRSGGKLDELNSILTSTQQKLNKFKATACGSLSNIFQRQSIDIPSTSDSIIDKVQRDQNKEDINSALDNLDEIKTKEMQSNVQIATNASLDIQKKMTSHLDKLDSLISKADNAELAMAAQNKQMKKINK